MRNRITIFYIKEGGGEGIPAPTYQEHNTDILPLSFRGEGTRLLTFGPLAIEYQVSQSGSIDLGHDNAGDR